MQCRPRLVGIAPALTPGRNHQCVTLQVDAAKVAEHHRGSVAAFPHGLRSGKRATLEPMPSAPTTRSAAIARSLPAASRTFAPQTRPSELKVRPTRVQPCRTTAPAVARRVHQGAIEQGTARRIQRLHTVCRADRDRHLFVAIVERGLAHRRRPHFLQVRQYAPAVQLQHAAAHQRVRGDGVRAVAGAVDDEYPKSGPCHQHRCGSSRAAGTDNQRIAGSVSEHARLPRYAATRVV